MQEPSGNPSAPLWAPGQNVWRTAEATRFACIIDADDYFRLAREAMLAAQYRITLIGWDFDARIRLAHHGERLAGEPACLGDFLLWLAHRNPALEVRLLRWDTGAFKTLFRGSTLLTVLRWKAHPRITLRLDAHHPFGSSHHQKIAIIDDHFAFCGGIDMTGDRWDTPAHTDDDPGRLRPNGKPYGPWHDAASALNGPAATALAELAYARWQAAGGAALKPLQGIQPFWPESLPPLAEACTVAIARTVPLLDEREPAHEIEQLYLDQIATARAITYIENQYFASRKIAQAIAKRLQDDDGPEIVVINPQSSEGWLEPLAMDSARARLYEALHRLDRHGRFALYHPVTAKGEAIYVHAKLMLVDDRFLRIGSSNFNNRSMRLDTECDVSLDSAEQAGSTLADNLNQLRCRLLSEHLGCEPETLATRQADCGSWIAAIESLRGPGRSLVPYTLPELGEVATWLADNEILDPEGPEEMFEPLSQRGLFRRWHFPRFRHRSPQKRSAPKASKPR